MMIWGNFLSFMIPCTAALMFMLWGRERWIKRQVVDFKERLTFYADMLDLRSDNGVSPAEPLTNLNFNPRDFLLDAGQHAILLGILKKVETKASALATILVFALAAVVTVRTASNEELSRFAVCVTNVMVGFLVPLLAFAIDSASHHGQKDYEKMVKAVCSPIRGRELQRALIMDAIRKEHRMDRAKYLIIASFFAAGVAFFADHFLG